MRTKEGYASVLGFSLFYRQFGQPIKRETLRLHGGLGATHDYLLSMAYFADHGYRVTFHHQLGCGRRQVPEDTSLFVAKFTIFPDSSHLAFWEERGSFMNGVLEFLESQGA